MEGYEFLFKKNVVTVWSAPNYCYRCGNIASILEVNKQAEWVFKVKQIDFNLRNSRKHLQTKGRFQHQFLYQSIFCKEVWILYCY